MTHLDHGLIGNGSVLGLVSPHAAALGRADHVQRMDEVAVPVNHADDLLALIAEGAVEPEPVNGAAS